MVGWLVDGSCTDAMSKPGSLMGVVAWNMEPLLIRVDLSTMYRYHDPRPGARLHLADNRIEMSHPVNLKDVKMVYIT